MLLWPCGKGLAYPDLAGAGLGSGHAISLVLLRDLHFAAWFGAPPGPHQHPLAHSRRILRLESDGVAELCALQCGPRERGPLIVALRVW